MSAFARLRSLGCAFPLGIRNTTAHVRGKDIPGAGGGAGAGGYGYIGPPPAIRINRCTSVRPVKQQPPKTEWQIAAEKEFLNMRKQFPKDEYLWYLTPDDVKLLSPEMRGCLTLRCGSTEDISRWRKQQLIRKFQRRPFDTMSHPVHIACLTEKILRVRTHLLRNAQKVGHQEAKKALRFYLHRRQKIMKRLYKVDYILYKHVCDELGLRCVRYAIPGKKDRSKMVNPQAVDGDHARFLIRQRMYHHRFRPREMREPGTLKLVRYVKHPLSPAPQSHGKAKATPQQISVAWPYGVRQVRVEGRQTVYNPTAPGPGFYPVPYKPFSGRTPI